MRPRNPPLVEDIPKVIRPGEAVSRRTLCSRLWGARGVYPSRNYVRDALRRLAAEGAVVMRHEIAWRDGRRVDRYSISLPEPEVNA